MADISAFENRIQAFERPLKGFLPQMMHVDPPKSVLSGGPMPKKVFLKLKFTLDLTSNFRALGI